MIYVAVNIVYIFVLFTLLFLYSPFISIIIKIGNELNNKKIRYAIAIFCKNA